MNTEPVKSEECSAFGSDIKIFLRDTKNAVFLCQLKTKTLPLQSLSFKLKKAAEAAFLVLHLLSIQTIPLLPYEIHHGLKQCVAGFD